MFKYIDYVLFIMIHMILEWPIRNKRADRREAELKMEDMRGEDREKDKRRGVGQNKEEMRAGDIMVH